MMRLLKDLDKDARIRVRDYVKSWPTLSAKELASDLYLKPTTIASIRANLTRNTAKKFNTLLSTTTVSSVPVNNDNRNQ